MGHQEVLNYLLTEARLSVFSMRAEIPDDHPLQGEITLALSALETLYYRTVNANEIYKRKLPD
jgi:hypothetical protein